VAACAAGAGVDSATDADATAVLGLAAVAAAAAGAGDDAFGVTTAAAAAALALGLDWVLLDEEAAAGSVWDTGFDEDRGSSEVDLLALLAAAAGVLGDCGGVAAFVLLTTASAWEAREGAEDAVALGPS